MLVDDVVSSLAAAGLAGTGTDWALVKRWTGDDPLPDQLLTVTEDGGASPNVATNAGVGSGTLIAPQVQVKVRGRPHGQDNGAAAEKMKEVWDHLHGILRETVGTTFYHKIQATVPEPIFVGWDEKNRPQFTTSFRATRSLTPAG